MADQLTSDQIAHNTVVLTLPADGTISEWPSQVDFHHNLKMRSRHLIGMAHPAIANKVWLLDAGMALRAELTAKDKVARPA